MNVGELKKYLADYKDEQEVKITTKTAHEIVVVPIPEVEAEPVNKSEGENVV